MYVRVYTIHDTRYRRVSCIHGHISDYNALKFMSNVKVKQLSNVCVVFYYLIGRVCPCNDLLSKISSCPFYWGVQCYRFYCTSIVPHAKNSPRRCAGEEHDAKIFPDPGRSRMRYLKRPRRRPVTDACECSSIGASKQQYKEETHEQSWRHIPTRRRKSPLFPTFDSFSRTAPDHFLIASVNHMLIVS